MGDNGLNLFVLVLLCFVGGWAAGGLQSNAFHRADLIQRGLGEYCATDGRFAFKGECEE